jgi:hypothetical protein
MGSLGGLVMTGPVSREVSFIVDSTIVMFFPKCTSRLSREKYSRLSPL